ncbi:MAG: CBS domain-containing protein [Rhodocyclaceae bacterium]|nr:MAG: CBS domain-containing protein [Rhodocyclaceae bacterium]
MNTRANTHLNLHSQLAAFIRQPPVCVPPEISLQEAVELMAERKIGSVVVAEPESQRPLGIFTLRDLLKQVASPSFDPSSMLLAIVDSQTPITLNWRATAYQAEILLARHGVHHVIVVDSSDRVIGIVSQSDILDVQRGGAKAMASAIRSARDLGSLVAAAEDIRRIGRQMLADGAAAEQLTETLSTLNDLLVERLLELTRLDFALPRVDWCWLAFGSEGRFEQTLSTDQDNGIIFSAAQGDADALRLAFLPFAQEVNRRLDACGFPLCKGNIMASNPELCLSLEEWKDRFLGWMRNANPDALLNATIFFDFRAIHGLGELAETLRDWLLEAVPAEPMFQRFMAENAHRAKPPIGFFGNFIVDKGDEYPRTLDLKAFGARPFVDAARILALANGIGETSTTQRLRALEKKGKLAGEDVSALIDGFYFIQQLRLRNQNEGIEEGRANRIEPAKLNSLDRHVLKEAFQQAKKLQLKLQMEYRL